MKLQILVPQYKETDEVVKALLDSISVQENVSMDDIGVIICNDGTDVKLSENLLAGYPYKIEYYQEPHRGVSGTRNACFDHAVADYVMFCDADDKFFNACGLWIVFKEIDKGFDCLISKFIEEYHDPKKNGEIVYMDHENDLIFVHGKVYNRQFLIDNGIRWNEDLTIHEDSFFNILALTTGKDVRYCKNSFYLWKWRDESVCRRDHDDYILKTYHHLIWSNRALILEFLSRKKLDNAASYFVLIVFDVYYNLNKDEWCKPENQKYRECVEQEFAKYFCKYRGLWDMTNARAKAEIAAATRNRVFAQGLLLEKITIDDWLKHIESLSASEGEMSDV